MSRSREAYQHLVGGLRLEGEREGAHADDRREVPHSSLALFDFERCPRTVRGRPVLRARLLPSAPARVDRHGTAGGCGSSTGCTASALTIVVLSSPTTSRRPTLIFLDTRPDGCIIPPARNRATLRTETFLRQGVELKRLAELTWRLSGPSPRESAQHENQSPVPRVPPGERADQVSAVLAGVQLVGGVGSRNKGR